MVSERENYNEQNDVRFSLSVALNPQDYLDLAETGGNFPSDISKQKPATY